MRDERRKREVVVRAGLLLAVAGAAGATELTPEIFGSAGVGRTFRVEDRSFGAKASAGGGAGVRIGTRWGVEGEYHQLLGLSLEPATCSVVTPPCVGSAREGLRSAQFAGVNVLYFFGRTRAQFYVTGGAGGLWSEETTTVVQVVGNEARFGEVEESNAGWTWNLGAGVRVPLTSGLALRPELRIYDATSGSRGNLGLVRASVALLYSW